MSGKFFLSDLGKTCNFEEKAKPPEVLVLVHSVAPEHSLGSDQEPDYDQGLIYK